MSTLHHRWYRKCLVALATPALVFTISGCGPNSSANNGDSTATADVAAAKALMEKYSAPMTDVHLPPLEKKPAPGKKVAIVVNSTPGSLSLKDGVVAAAEALGWTAIPVIYDAAKPTGLIDAFAQAVDDAPDGVVTTALNQSDYAQAAASLKEKGIPVVTSTTTDPVSAPVIANVSNSASWAESGRSAAAYVVAKLGGKASVAMFNIPSFPILKVYEDAFRDEYHSLCADCHYESHPVQPGDIGTKVPTQVVSAVQRTPSINVALMGFGAVSTGVSGALASAGLNDVKVLGISASMDNITALSKGTEEMWVGFPLQTLGWKSVDALARYFNNEPVEVATTVQTPIQILTKDNVADHPELPEVVDYAGIFKKLWLVE
jgi:ribose transport system substrate-binding protein